LLQIGDDLAMPAQVLVAQRKVCSYLLEVAFESRAGHGQDLCGGDNTSLHAYATRPGQMLGGELDFALLSGLGRLAKRAPVTGRREPKRRAGSVTSGRGHFLALGRMLEAIKC
jgi:hypothetical protein